MSTARHGAVAAGHALTAGTARDVLAGGGNAFDAAVAAAWMAMVCEPVLASVGGGGFAMVKAGGGAPALFDFFAQTPLVKNRDAGDFREIFADFGEAKQGFHIGCAATATPGLVPGLYHLHGRHGVQPMADLLAPAIAAARGGVAVTAYQHFLSTIVAPILVASAEARALFAPSGDLIATGERFANAGLGDLLDGLAGDGMGYYCDHVVPAILTSLGDDGHLSGDDFTAYAVEEREPLEIQLGGLTVWLNPLPSAGGTLIAHTLDAMSEMSATGFAKALERTDRDRADAASALSVRLNGAGPASYRGTTHISVIDRDGNACSLTLSNGEGNGEIAGGLGFMPNNMLGESDVNPLGALGWAENRRLSSIMCPAVGCGADGAVFALGSGGSNRIRSAIAAVLWRLSEGGGGLQAAVGAPRMHVEAGHLDVEGQFADADLEALKRCFGDHRVWAQPNMFFGGCHGVMRGPDGELSGAGDGRRDGVAYVC